MKDGWKEVKVYIKDEGKEEVETPKEVFQKLYHLAKKYNCRFSEIDKVFEINNDLSDKDLRTVIEEFEHWNNILKIHLYTDFKLSRFTPEEKKKRTNDYDNKDLWIDLLYEAEGKSPTGKCKNMKVTHQTVRNRLMEMKPFLKPYITNDEYDKHDHWTKLFRFFENNKRIFDDVWGDYHRSRSNK